MARFPQDMPWPSLLGLRPYLGPRVAALRYEWGRERTAAERARANRRMLRSCTGFRTAAERQG
jgi:hypothetical protein